MFSVHVTSFVEFFFVIIVIWWLHCCLFDISFTQVCAAQAISGTGSLRLGMEFLKKFHSSEVIYVSKPTWGEDF